MKLQFSLVYGTAWGENMFVVIDYRSADGTVSHRELPMNTDDGWTWTLETAAHESRRLRTGAGSMESLHHIASFAYHYELRDGAGRTLRREWDMCRRELPFDPSHDYIMPDEWRDMPLQYHLYTKACTVTRNTCAEETARVNINNYRRTIIFRVSAPQLKAGENVAIVGSHPAVGGWNASRYLRMQYEGNMQWVLSVNVMGILFPLEYKYVIVDDSTGELKTWEEGENRSTGGHEVKDGQVLVLDGGVMRVKEDAWRAAGVAVPVFSLRSKHSYGVGDFEDLKRMVDWAALVGMKVIQLLPVNDTTTNGTWTDSDPYNIISAYALHPQYIDLEAAGVLDSAEDMIAFHRQRQELNALPYTDYEAVQRVKGRYMEQLYREKGDETLKTAEFKAFLRDNEHWLKPYAEYISDVNNVKRIHDHLYTYYIQYILHKQLLEASEYAHSKGIALKGDVPIGMARNSVETRTAPQYFNLNSQAGLPPDAYSTNGTNWGFPTYNRETMIADGCAWWRSRLRHMEQYFDAVRIDHVLAFFRIWEIPEDAVQGVMGHFYPALPLTAGEIEYFGLPFRRDLLTRPFINDNVIDRIFGIHADYVRNTFLNHGVYGLYELKDDCNTQRKVEALLEGKNDENSTWIRDGLYKLISNVLFVVDPRDNEMFHPRIMAQGTTVFKALPNEEKEAYMRLYNNYFFMRHDAYWGNGAMRMLAMALHDTRMMICAEDLGMLPDCVARVLDAMRINTLEIQTMPKQEGYEFAHLEANPYRSVATFSTHDMSPMRLWWSENPERTQRYYVTMLQKEGRAPEQLPAHIAEEINARHLYCPSMMCILSIQDWLAMDGELRQKDVRSERINMPSDIYNRWKYRMHITIEELMAAETYNRKLKTMITRARRFVQDESRTKLV